MIFYMSPQRLGFALAAILLLTFSPFNVRAQNTRSPFRSTTSRQLDPSALHPASFTENIGQWDSETRLQGIVGSTTVRFTPTSVGYYYNVDSIGASPNRDGRPGRLHGYYLSTEFLGAHAEPEIEGEDRAEGLYNYYLGRTEKDWHLGAHAYRRVRYRDLYDGVDALYYGTAAGMKYDFVVSPGADHRSIALRYRGAEHLSITPNGELEVRTPFGTVREAPPYSYQMIGGKKVEVRARYRLLGPDSYGFTLGSYNARYPVTIDPCLTVQYVTYLGGGGYDVVTNMASDSSGNAFAVGFTRAPDFPVVPGIGTVTQDNYIFLTKLTPDGSRIIYSTLLANPYTDAYDMSGPIQTFESIGEDVEVARNGDAFVALATNIDNLPTTGGTHQGQLSAENNSSACGTPPANNFDSYIVRIDRNGRLLWGTYLGGSQNDYVTDISLDPNDHLLLTGFTFAPTCGGKSDTLTYPVTGVTGQFNSGENARGFETFISKLSPDGRTLEFSALYGGKGNEIATKIASDATGKAWIFGSTNSRNLVTTADALEATPEPGLAANGYDLYLAQIDPAAGTLLYSTYYCDTARNGSRSGLGVNPYTTRGTNMPLVSGFGNQERRQGLAVSPQSGVIFFGGTTRSITLPTTSGAFQGARHNLGANGDNASDCFVVKVDVNARRTLGATYLGGSGLDAMGGLTLDPQGDVVVSVATSSTDFPISSANIQEKLRDTVDAALVILPGDLGWFSYGTYVGGSARPGGLVFEQMVYGVTVDPDGGIYLFGGTSSPDLPVTPGALSSQNDYYGGYIVKFAPPAAQNIGTAGAIDFPSQPCPGPIIVNHSIFNAGGQPLAVDSVVFVKKKYFSLANAPAFPLTLGGCGSEQLQVIFDPTNAPCDEDVQDTLLIYASTAENKVTRVVVNAKKACLYFFFSKTSITNNDFKLGKHDFFQFQANVAGNFTQTITVRPHPGNKGIFGLISPLEDAPMDVGPNYIIFDVNTIDTGYYCESFDVTVQPCNRQFTLNICAYIRTGIFSTTRPVDLGVISCGETDFPLVIHNTGNDSLKFRLLYVGGNTPSDIEYDPSIRDTQSVAVGDSVVLNIFFRPKGVGKRQAILVFDTDQGLDYQRQQWVELDAELDTVEFNLSAENVVGGFGETVELPIHYAPIREGRAPTTEITFLTKFNPSMLDISGVDGTGTLTDGWEMVENSYQPGVGGRVRLKMRPGGRPLEGAGLLTKLRLKVLRGDSISTPLDIELAGASKGCFQADIDSGFAFQLNAECAAYARLLSSSSRLLKQSLPNPAGAFVTIPYTIPEPGGAVTLRVYDVSGRLVATLIDRTLPAGNGQVQFDGGRLSPGLYYYRLTIDGTTSDTRTMVIER